MTTPTTISEDKPMTESARKIDADTGPFERFLVGDHVAHFKLGDGTVTGNDGRIVQVTYVRRYPDNVVAVCGQNVKQNYDAAWFKNNPRMLFHRGVV